LLSFLFGQREYVRINTWGFYIWIWKGIYKKKWFYKNGPLCWLKKKVLYCKNGVNSVYYIIVNKNYKNDCGQTPLHRDKLCYTSIIHKSLKWCIVVNKIIINTKFIKFILDWKFILYINPSWYFFHYLCHHTPFERLVHVRQSLF
jgi:hypothetical protein